MLRSATLARIRSDGSSAPPDASINSATGPCRASPETSVSTAERTASSSDFASGWLMASSWAIVSYGPSRPEARRTVMSRARAWRPAAASSSRVPGPSITSVPPAPASVRSSRPVTRSSSRPSVIRYDTTIRKADRREPNRVGGGTRDMTVHRRLLVPCAILIAACLPAPAADGAGLPVPSAASGRVGTVAPGGSERLIARRDGDNTIVVAVRRGSGRVLRSARIGGRWTVPAVTLGIDTTGLSADGATLVLVHPARRFPTTRTKLAVLDARTLTVRRRITLNGFFTVDAISPNGQDVYLVQYPGGDPLAYRVRALDVRTGRLIPGDIVDPREPDEQMAGMPYQRAVSADGRWAYTLYGGGTETFIHAIDTVGRTAACIDLEMLPPQGDLSRAQLNLSADGSHIFVSDRGHRVAIVDTKTFAVTEPGGETETAPEPATAAATPQPAGPAPAAARTDDGGFPFVVLLIAGGVGVAALLVLRRRDPVGATEGEPQFVDVP